MLQNLISKGKAEPDTFRQGEVFNLYTRSGKLIRDKEKVKWANNHSFRAPL